MKANLCSVTFFHIAGLRNTFWALSQMQLGHAKLAGTRGMQFYKLMGSGAGEGFSIRPDLSTFVLLQTWKDRSDADDFLQHHPFSTNYRQHAAGTWTVFLAPTRVKGTWDGKTPFEVTGADEEGAPIAVLTRATIYPGKLYSFWKNVPRVRPVIRTQKGCLYTKGIGEYPLLLQATFSLWETREHMVDFAYRHPRHVEMIRKTQDLGWYREEMFAEFIPTEITHAGAIPDIIRLLSKRFGQRSSS